MTSEFVLYDDMTCECGRPLYVREVEARAEIVCNSCGVVANKMLTKCHGPSCNARIFFGGKKGGTPINVRTGASHFIDCVDAQRFRKSARKADAKPVEKPQGTLL